MEIVTVVFLTLLYIAPQDPDKLLGAEVPAEYATLSECERVAQEWLLRPQEDIVKKGYICEKVAITTDSAPAADVSF